ncbi:MAG: putative Na+/H+ antiporter [Ideonella sp.]|nr:putative Na+/H+ antiporter [Ideonella sp.]MCC7458075.1 putative Na+/H+ antiporter [Nitrospira sp.]
MLTETLDWVSAAIFAVALVHTFSTAIFEKLAHRQPAHAGLWHLLGEVEIVFGFWAMVLVLVIFVGQGAPHAINYLEERNYTEPLFVFAIMVVAGTRPILDLGARVVSIAARLLPLPSAVASYFVLLGLVPLMGSVITEPAAMTLAALLLRDRYFVAGTSARLKYVTLGVLFVNVSIGGVLTSFAAPPVLMVAGVWGWDTPFMLSHFGWKAAIAVAINAAGATLLLKRELSALPAAEGQRSSTPWVVMVAHVLFLAGIVAFAHHPPVFLGLLMLFLGFATAYTRHQDRLMLREGLLVAFFLCGLVVLGGQQAWWLQPLLSGLSADAVLVGATALTAVTDNAALTYLGSLVPNLSDEFKYALVSGAVAGGGLTVIANAPNPAGFAILRGRFENETVQPSRLLVAALIPTLVALAALRWL